MVSLLTYKWTNYQNNNTYLCFVAVVTKSKPGEKTFRPNINQEISVEVPVGALTRTDWTTAQWKPDLTDSMTDEITPFSPLAVAISKWLFWVSTNLDAAFQRLKDTDCSFCNERRDIYRQYVFCTRLIRAGHASTWKNVNLEQKKHLTSLSNCPKLLQKTSTTFEYLTWTSSRWSSRTSWWYFLTPEYHQSQLRESLVLTASQIGKVHNKS